MSDLRLMGVSNYFLKEIDLQVPGGSTFGVVGPSGAGKTSLLRVIAGLARHQGRILLDGTEIQSHPPNRRSIGFVSQDLHLFPHLTLEGNLFLAMKRTGQRTGVRRRRAWELLEMLRITDLAKRKPATFSGGEKQRAALARVLASAPKLLLLDEPFSKLDFRTARYLRAEFKSLRERLGLTTIIVTHNMEEAGELAETLAVMQSGSLAIIEDGGVPASMDCGGETEFLDTPNLIPCRIKNRLDHGLVELSWAGGLLLFPDENRPLSRLAVRRQNVIIGSAPPPGPVINRFTGLVHSVESGDDSVRVALEVNGLWLRVEMSHHQWEAAGLAPGQEAHGLLKMNLLEAVC